MSGGNEESHELIYSYGLEDEYLEELEDYDEDDYNLEDCTSYSDRGWRAWKIRDDITLSARELDKKCCSLGEKIFVNEYCEKDTLF